MNITSKTRIDSHDGYDIIHHRKSLYLRVNGVIITNRRGRPKKFVEYQHIQQYIEAQKEAMYACHEVMKIYREASQAMQDTKMTLTPDHVHDGHAIININLSSNNDGSEEV